MGTIALEQRKGAVIQFHAHAVQRGHGLFIGDFDEMQDDRLVRAKRRAGRDAKQEGITDLAGRAGDRHTNRGFAHIYRTELYSPPAPVGKRGTVKLAARAFRDCEKRQPCYTYAHDELSPDALGVALAALIFPNPNSFNAVSADQSEKRTLAAIMFTDLVGYSALAQRNEPLALELLAESQRLLRAQFPRFNGREVKSTGDGFLVEFPSALHGTQCAVEIQLGLAVRNAAQPAPRHLRVRIGLHVGEVVHRENDLYGDGVNVAARIEPLATGGGICLSDTVFAQVRNKLDLQLVKLDAPKLKHIEVPMEVYRVVLPGQPVPAAGTPPTPPPARQILRQFRVPAALGLFALVAAAGLLGLHSSGWKKTGPALTAAAPIPRIPPGPPRTADPHSVAVLPFENRSADPTDEYLSDGLTEELLNALARVRGLRVPGRASSFAFKGRTGHDIYHQIGNQLHVATALGGSVSKAGDKLRVTAQLINVDDGFVLWATNYYGDMQDLFTFQTQVAERVVRALSVKLGVEESRELETPPTANPEAHRQYLLGRALFNKGSISNFTASMPYFQRAIQLDPHFALAYCGLADAYGFTSGILMPGRQGWAKEQELARQALALDPKLAEAHFSLGLALASAFQWAEGETEIKRAIEMNPNLAVAYDQYAFLLTCLGRHDEAIAMSRHAVALDPISPLMNIDLGWWLLFARRYDAAVAQCHQALALESAGFAGALGAGLEPAVERRHKRRHDGIRAGPETGSAAFLRSAARLRLRGHRPSRPSRTNLAGARQLARTNYASPGLQAYPSLGLGETEKIYGCLNQSLEEQDYPVQFLKVDPAFDPLRGDPRFQALLKKAGLNP